MCVQCNQKSITNTCSLKTSETHQELSPSRRREDQSISSTNFFFLKRGSSPIPFQETKLQSQKQAGCKETKTRGTEPKPLSNLTFKLEENRDRPKTQGSQVRASSRQKTEHEPRQKKVLTSHKRSPTGLRSTHSSL